MAPSSGLSEIGTLSKRVEVLVGEKKKFQSLIEGAPLGILIVQDWKPVFANPSLAKMFGYRGPGALLKLVSLDPLIAPADRPRLLEFAGDLLGGKKASKAIELQGVRRNEQLIWVEFQARPVEWGGHPALHIWANDITEQKRTEAELRESQNSAAQAHARLFDAIESLPGSFALYDSEDRFVLCNGQTRAMFPHHSHLLKPGTPYEAIIRHTVEKGLVEIPPDQIEEYVRGRAREHRRSEGVILQQWADGRRFAVYHRPTSDGGTVSVRMDVTEQNRNEEELQKSKNLLDVILDNIPSALSVVDRNLNMVAINRNFVELLGFPPELARGWRTFEDFTRYNAERGEYGPGDVETLVRERVELARKFQPHQFERVRPDGKTLEIRGNPIPDGGFITTYTDISDRKEAERQANEARERLMDAVNSISEGFVLYDSEDRLELCNSQFRNLFPEIQDLIRPGRSFEEMIRESAARGFFPEAVGDPQGWVEERIRQHRNPGPTYERPISGGRWISGREHRTKEGGIVGIWGDITERKRAEEELRANQRLLQTVFDTIPQSVFVKDRDSRYLMVNNAMAARFNLQPKDFQGAHTMDILGGSEEERKRRVENDRLVLQTGQRVDVPEFPITTPDGEKRIQHVTKLPFLDDSGNVIGVVGVADDITQRKDAEEALRVSEKTLSEGQQIAHFGSWTWEPEPERAHWSDELYRILGCEPQEFEGSFEAIVDFVHPEDKAQFSNMLMAAIRGKGPYDFEHRIVRRDGTVRYVHELAEVSHDSEGRTKQVVGTMHDITERTLAERALRESELNLRTLIFNIPVILFSFNAEGKILSMAGKGLELLNLEAGDLAGQNILALVHNHPEIEGDIRQALRGEEVTSERRYGKFVFEYRYRPVHNAQGKLLSVIGLTVDVTERKRIERQLEEERENLEKTVVERTQDLKQSLASLEDSNLKLQGANLAKSRFLSSMSHELRTPLNAIIGFSDLLRGRHFGPLNDKQAGYVEQIDNAGKHLLSLINDLLDMAKIDAGGMEVQLEAISLGAFFSSIAAMMSSQFRRKNLALAVEIEPGLTTLTADSRKVRQIMLNLLSNAVKFTPAGGRVEIRVAPGGDSEIRIAVADTGIGIEKEELESIFSEFHQAPSARREQVGGTGIGLALTRRLVELHGGTIGVESRIGQGSTFQVVLPKRGVPTGAPHEPKGDLAQSESYPSGRRILVAEDNEVNLALILDMLSVHGHATTIARNGQEAVEQAR
ncbi:MAG: PAS-domain containing protein, partial [SAR324 cluster bacterium]|nr:PAS-domain containing protein [SAR324 cluster bacterium]